MAKFYLNPTDSLSEAVAKASAGDVIFLCERVYNEKIKIDKENITIIGKGENSKIVFSDYAKKINPDDGLEFNTFRTYTVCVAANGVTLKNLCIENGSGNPKERGQAVALSVYGDNFTGENLWLKSFQDTLFCGPLPDDLITRYYGFLNDDIRYAEGELTQIFENCKIFGCVDYVFGCGRAFFYNCDFITLPDGRQSAYVAAPAHSLKQTIGFTFIDCRFERQGAFDCEIYLARPWRDYGKAVFIGCDYAAVCPKIFDKWGNTDRDRSARFELSGNIPPKAVCWLKQLTAEQEQNYKKIYEKTKEKISRKI